MRYLAWLLLAANLGLFVWIFSQPVQQPPQYQPIPLPPDIAPLLLLSERSPNAGVDESPPDTQLEPETADQPVADEQQVKEEQEVGGEKAPPVSADDEGKVTAQLVCRTVGPLLAEADAQAISKQLSDQGYAPRTRTGEVREPSGYWVYMPAMPAREARRIVAELDTSGMKDYFIGKQNYISLGIFSRKDKAQTRLGQVQALGFDAVLDQRYRTRNVYWLDIEERDKPLLGSELWLRIQAQHADIRVQRVSCD